MTIDSRDAEATIDHYLDDLLDRLTGPGHEVRRVLAEVDDHLHETIAALVAADVEPAQAATTAVERFGSPALVARRIAAERGARWSTAALRQFVLAFGLLCVVGCLAIGASGLVAWGMGATAGSRFVAGDPPGTHISAARCAQYLDLRPHAGSCTAAALADHYGETVFYRLAVGVLGLIGLGALVVLRRRFGRRVEPRILPDSFVATVGTVLFGVAAAALAVTGTDQARHAAGRGAGANLSGALVAATVAAWFAWQFVRSLTPTTSSTA